MSATLRHSGLPAGISRSNFIDLVAPALKARGLRTSAIVYLSRAFNNWTRDQDYGPDRICGFWHSVRKLSDQLTCTSRTVCSIECELEGDYISKSSKANGGREGDREKAENGTVRYLFGINLAPIIEKAAELLAEAEAIRIHERAMDICRKEIRHTNKKIRLLQNKGALVQAETILPNGRSAIVKDLKELRNIRDALVAVENAFTIEARSAISSDQPESFDLPIVQTKQSKFLYEPEAVSEHVTVQQAVALAAEPFRECLAMYGDYTWRGVTNAAYEIARSMAIDDRSWAAACDPTALGPERAALCVILIHRNLYLPPKAKHLPKNPAACFGGMIKKAKNGTLDLLRFMHAVRNLDERTPYTAKRTVILERRV